MVGIFSKIVFLVLQFMVFLYDNPQRFILPEELGLQNNIILGMSISQLRNERNLKDVDSAPCWHEGITGNRYFESIDYNCDNEYFSSNPRTLVTIGLDATYQEADSHTDSLALEIIGICRKYFKGNENIVDSTRGEGCRLLVWRQGNVTAAFSYFPADRYKAMKEINKGLVPNQFLEISLRKKMEDYLKR